MAEVEEKEEKEGEVICLQSTSWRRVAVGCRYPPPQSIRNN